MADRAEEWFPGSDVGYQMRAGLRGFTVPQWSAALEVLRTRPRGQWRFQYLMGILRGIAANGMPEPVAPAGRVAVGGGPPPELDDAELIRRAQARRAAREERKKGWAK